MNFDVCEIYKRKKLIGILPCKFVKKTELCDEHLLMRDTYNIKPGYILLTNKCEKFFVTDIRFHHSQDHKIEIYFESVANHKNRVKTEIKVNISLGIALFSLIVSIVALIKSFFVS